MEDEHQTRQRRRESRNSSIRSGEATDLNQNVVLQIEDSLTNVPDDEDKDELYSKTKNKVSGSFTIISVVVLVSLTLLFVKYMDARLPTSLTVEDLVDDPKTFIEERARNDLKTLTEIGVRVSGSYSTDIVSVDVFVDILKKIQSEKNSLYDVEYDVQRPSGSFWLEDDEGSTSSYANVANVVAKLEPTDVTKRTNSSILLNCHFDTKPGSPGATDNMISCSVMLEILRVFSSQTSLVVRNTIVFLFNGAEELGLQGAHGFVKGKTSSVQVEKGHPWSKHLKAFVNLEGAGGGGREILFQATGGDMDRTGWLLEAYRSGPYPYGTVLAEEAFQFGLIPSDTDFRIFRDFSGTPGLDMAFIKNGWVYHTKWDKLSEIPPGSIQHMGTNAMAIAEHLGNIDFSAPEKSSKEIVFFDVLGAFMISYSKTVGIVINLIVALLTLGIIMWEVGWKLKIFLTYIWYLASTILAWGLAIGSAALVALILNGAGYPKPFYSYPILASVLFGVPSFITQILAYSYCTKSSPKDSWMAGKFTLAIVLLIATFITRAAYIFAIPLIFGIVGWFAAKYLMRGWPKAIMITYIIIGEVIPLVMSSYLVVTLTDVFVPILGRSGSETDANMFFGIIISAMLTILVLNGLSALFVNYDKRVLFTCLFISVFLVNPLIVFGFIGKVPYQEKTPLRLSISNVDRTWYDLKGTETKSESGYWFWPLDADTKDFFPHFSKTVSEVNSVKDVKLDYANCEDLYCAQPFIWPNTEIIKKTHWIPISNKLPLIIRDQVNMRIMENTAIGTPDRRRISLEFFGPNQMTVIINPQLNWEATISIEVLGENIQILQEGKNRWKGRKVYYIYHGRGYENFPLKVNMELRMTADPSQGQGDHLINIQQSGLFLHSSEAVTANFADFISRFPSWTYNMGWASVMKMHVV